MLPEIKKHRRTNSSRRLRHTSIVQVLAGSVLVAMSACASPPVEKPSPGSGDVNDAIRYGRAFIQELMEKDDVPGVSVVFVNDRKVLWAEGFGWASQEDATKMTAQTPMKLASVTKVLTAVAIMQLVERGIVSLDAPISKYLPEFSIQSRFDTTSITIRQILSHHSGLPHDRMQGFKLYTGEDAAPDDLIEQFRNLPKDARSLHLTSAPGQVHSYSNLGFALLGSVIERTTETAYWDYLEKHLFQPLGMSSSAIVYPNHESGIKHANGFTPEGEINHRYIRDISSGGLASSAEDMGKVLLLLQGKFPEVLSPQSAFEMRKVQNESAEFDGDLRFGLALFLSPDHVRPKSLGHTGDDFPYHAALQVLPDEGFGVVVMTNSTTGQSLVREAASQILDVAYHATSRAHVSRQDDPELTNATVTLTEAQAQSYTGQYYAFPDLGIVEVVANGTDLVVDFHQTRLADAKLIPKGNHLFDIRLRLFGFVPLPTDLVLSGPKLQLQFETINDTQHAWITTDGMRGSIPIAVPVKPKPVPDSWMQRIGRYEVMDTESNAGKRR